MSRQRRRFEMIAAPRARARLIEDPEDDRALAELHEEQRQMGQDPDYVKWLMEVEAALNRDLGVDRDK